MAVQGKGARRKGHQFERDMANKLTKDTGAVFRRGLGQSRGGGAEEADVMSEAIPQLHFELKRQKRCNIRAALRQAENDASEGQMLVAITKDDRQPTLVTMRYEDWVLLFAAWIHQE